jgi:hypothetical protein
MQSDISPDVGSESTCYHCGKKITFGGKYWYHTDTSPRHPAKPVEDTIKSMCTTGNCLRPKYRLLVVGDTIEKDDEYLSDDCETWIKATEQIFAGRGIKYNYHTSMKFVHLTDVLSM